MSGPEQAVLINEIIRAVKRAERTGEWVVIVCPDAEAKKNAGRMLAASVDAGAKFSGRTAVLANGGRISVACAKDAVFVPDKTPYVVGFAGWTSAHDIKEQRTWQDKSAASLT
jgi:hypothetical protein